MRAVFVTATSKVNGKLAGEYDDQIGSMWYENVTVPYVRGEKSLDACVSDFKTAVREALPTIAVE